MKIRAAVLYEQGLPRPYADSTPLVIEDLELDPPGADEVLMEIRAAGLCHSDLSSIEGVRQRALPMVIGHEAAGVVREVGANVTEVTPGQHIVTSFVSPCGACPACLGGRPNICETHWQARNSGALLSGARRLRLNGEYINHGSGISAFAEYTVVSRRAVIPIDENIPLDIAALFGCAVMTGVGAVMNTARVPAGASVAVVGLGGVGLNALMAAALCDAQPLIAMDLNSEKRKLAGSLGATHLFDPRDGDAEGEIIELTRGGVDFAFEMAGAIAAMECAYRITRRGGVTVSAGLPHHAEAISIPLAAMVSDERTIKGSYMGSCAPGRDVPK
ncbi:MAG: alcohol dehydrogenase catalytic domain-containing protein, partial [Gammaproteobacteria bacterium]|nr:alcohol dehydrogenase catalytic domain-containing protein [Gammaproteobacteria bacterium]